MTAGRLIAVVGPSGVGKDSLIAALAQRRPDLHVVRRTITRAAGSEGEDFDAISAAQFDQYRDDGAFCLHWGAHELHYGIPSQIQGLVDNGQDAVVNLSRSVLPEAATKFGNFVVLNVTAKRQTLAARLAQRGRETTDEITKRLAQADKPLPAGIAALTINNDGSLQHAVDQALTALYPDRV